MEKSLLNSKSTKREIYPDKVVDSVCPFCGVGCQTSVSIKENEIVLTADTLVWYKNKCWGKPKDKNEAKQMLKLFSGNSHDVITSVGFLTTKGFKILTESTEVTYKELNKDEIDYYVDTMNPTDKAGSYGIQDWIGMIGIEKIIGSYTSVLGLPVPQVINEIISIIKNEG